MTDGQLDPIALMRKINELESKIDALRTITKGWSFIPLTTPLTSTSWDGDARSTTAKTKIDLSAVFGVPAGVKAVLCNIIIRDSGSAANNTFLVLSPNNTSAEGSQLSCAGLTNDAFARGNLIVPCNGDGDIYYQIFASGASTMDVYILIWGYWI